MKDTLPDRVRLGGFELDLRAGELRDRERTVRLQQQPFQILLMLVERGGEVVTREEIQKKLWPNDTVVEFDHSINAAIKKLRQALGDSADNPQYVETVARRGYRLLIPVEKAAGAQECDADPSPENGRAPSPQPAGGKSKSGMKLLHYRLKEVIGGKSAEALPAANPDKITPSPWTGSLLGKKVSHYRVLEVIGGGGMGVVYKAEDLKLGRQVALKFLPEEMAWDPAALRRFEREARTASSLDHLNICTIYEVEEYEDQPFIVMQLLHGETLHARLAAAAERQETLPLEELLEIAAGIAAGLQAAHEKGVIHRDIKPANIFLTKFGQVKILDFGLAKLASSAKDYGSDGVRFGTDGSIAPAPSRATETTLTRFGATMGTAAYMSPEQVRAEPLDERSDIFSFGLVLYQMATGQCAFRGDSVVTVEEAILSCVPAPVRDLNPDVPPDLEAVINKALEKDREQRYQTAAELRSELQLVRSEAGVRRHRWALWSSGLLLAMLVALAVAWFARGHMGSPQELTEQQITANPQEDYVIAAAISPDGKYVAYQDQTGMYLRTLESGEIHRVTLPAELRTRIYYLCWLPGGGKLLASVAGANGDWDLWVITILGEAESHLLYRHAMSTAISPDGRRIAFTSGQFGELWHEVWIGGVNGESPRKLVTAGEQEEVLSPVWSPNGRWIAYGRRWKTAQGFWSSVIEARPVDGGPAKTLIAESSLSKSNALTLGGNGWFTEAWSPDWRLVFAVGESPEGSESRSAQTKYSLWAVEVKPRTGEAAGKAGRLTQWSSFAPRNLTFTPDGKRLSLLKERLWLDVYLTEFAADGTGMKAPRRLTLDDRGSNASDWTRDGQAILFSSRRNGKLEIFKQGLNQNVAETVIAGPADVFGGAVSPDGSWFLYWESESTRGAGGASSNSVRLMRRAIAGGSPEPVLEALPEEVRPRFSCPSNANAGSACVLGLLKGRELVFYSLDPLRGKANQLGKIEVIGGYMGWGVSPDGSRLALVDAEKYEGRIEVLTLPDGAWHEIPLQPKGEHLQSIAWAADGKSFYATSYAPESYNLLHVTLDGKVRPELPDGRRQWLTSPLPSRDGKHLVFNAQTWDSNVWMMDNF
ncbi:MAG: protein kinase [Candidatus Korobacteraceae bacterium]